MVTGAEGFCVVVGFVVGFGVGFGVVGFSVVVVGFSVVVVGFSVVVVGFSVVVVGFGVVVGFSVVVVGLSVVVVAAASLFTTHLQMALVTQNLGWTFMQIDCSASMCSSRFLPAKRPKQVLSDLT